MFLAHPELKKELWGGHLWNPSYCAVTVSDRSREQVCSYIEGQKENSNLKESVFYICKKEEKRWKLDLQKQQDFVLG